MNHLKDILCFYFYLLNYRKGSFKSNHSGSASIKPILNTRDSKANSFDSEHDSPFIEEETENKVSLIFEKLYLTLLSCFRESYFNPLLILCL